MQECVSNGNRNHDFAFQNLEIAHNYSVRKSERLWNIFVHEWQQLQVDVFYTPHGEKLLHKYFKKMKVSQCWEQ